MKEKLINEMKNKDPKQCVNAYYYYKKSNRMTKDETIEILEEIEKINPLGALYIADLQESELAGDYIKGFLSRNKGLIKRNIQVNSPVSYKYFQQLIICFMHMDNDSMESICKDIFTSDHYKNSEIEGEGFIDKEYASEKYASRYSYALRKFDPEIKWEKSYLRIANCIHKSRKDDGYFLKNLEDETQKLQWSISLSDDDSIEYFRLLCSYSAYESAGNFLLKFDPNCNRNEKTEEIINDLFSYSCPSLFSIAKLYKKKWAESENKQYTYNDWMNDILCEKIDDNCIKWIKLTVFFHSLKEAVENEDLDLFETILKEANGYDLYDMEKIQDCYQIVKSISYIVNTFMCKRDYKRLIFFLHSIERINIFSNRNTKYLELWKHPKTPTVGRIEDALFDEALSLEDSIYIFMNSNLKCCMFIEDYVIRFANELEEKRNSGPQKNLKDYFMEYPLWGQITLGNANHNARNKIYLFPIGVETKLTFKNVNNARKKGKLAAEDLFDNHKLFRNDDTWYLENRQSAEMLTTDKYCQCVVNSYDRLEGIKVRDIVLDVEMNVLMNNKMDDIEKKLDDFGNTIEEWLAEIKEKHVYVEWNKKNKIFSKDNLNEDLRIKIAIGVLEAISGLQKANNIHDLDLFLKAITSDATKRINEFRYIKENLMFKSFPRGLEKYKEQIECIWMALLGCEMIEPKQKAKIYMNTCIKKYCDFKLLYDLLKEDTRFLKDTVLSLRFENRWGEKSFSSTQWKSSVYSQERFVYVGDLSGLENKYYYFCSLKGYDDQRRCFELQAVGLTKDQINKWQKMLNSIKSVKQIEKKDYTSKSITEKFDAYDEIREELKPYKGIYEEVTIESDQIQGFIDELSKLFETCNYSVRDSVRILDAISDVNPFINDEIKEIISDFFNNLDHNEEYLTYYDRFIEDYKNNCPEPSGICELYSKFYFKFLIPFDKFVQDIKTDRITENSIIDLFKENDYSID